MAHLAEAEAPTPQLEPQPFRESVRTWKQARMCSMPVANLPIEYSTTRRRTADACIQIIPERTRAQLNSPTRKDQGHNQDRTFALVTVRVHSEEEGTNQIQITDFVCVGTAFTVDVARDSLPASRAPADASTSKKNDPMRT